MKHRPLYQIAQDIRKDWKNVNNAAKPYLDALGLLDQVTDGYYLDSGRLTVLYFLANAKTWHGKIAKSIKNELKSITK